MSPPAKLVLSSESVQTDLIVTSFSPSDWFWSAHQIAAAEGNRALCWAAFASSKQPQARKSMNTNSCLEVFFSSQTLVWLAGCHIAAKQTVHKPLLSVSSIGCMDADSD